MTAGPIDTVAKYFFFASLNEQISFAASLQALAELKSKNWLGFEFRARWIQVLARRRAKLKVVTGKSWHDALSRPGIALPPDFDLTAWSHFMTTGNPVEVDAVLFSKILGFSDDEIASALKVTLGTVRYRVGRGLRHLGGYLES